MEKTRKFFLILSRKVNTKNKEKPRNIYPESLYIRILSDFPVLPQIVFNNSWANTKTLRQPCCYTNITNRLHTQHNKILYYIEEISNNSLDRAKFWKACYCETSEWNIWGCSIWNIDIVQKVHLLILQKKYVIVSESLSWCEKKTCWERDFSENILQNLTDGIKDNRLKSLE